MSEKQVVFDVDGNPKELRYYEHDRLTARLGVILDGDKNFIGLRELDVAEVSPPSWLEKLKQWGKPPPKPRINILTVDFIGLINWINTIKTIKTIENIDLVDRIALIDNITNVGTLNLLNTVNLIKSISSIDSITSIANISKIGDVSFPLLGNYIVNGNFQFGDFRGWYLEGTVPTISNGFWFSTSPYCAKIAYSVLGASNRMTSYFNRAVKTNDIYLFTMTAAYDSAAATKTVAVFFLYSDRSYSEQDVTVTNAGVTYNLTPTANKTLIGVVFANSGTAGYYAYVNTVILLAREHTEREDLLCKSFDLTVGTTSLLAAVASQSHKVYGWDYESDTAGANEFSATINATANTKFGRRVTAGVHAMTLVHPIVCDVNTALSFISAGNTKLSLRYKTEA